MTCSVFGLFGVLVAGWIGVDEVVVQDTRAGVQMISIQNPVVGVPGLWSVPRMGYLILACERLLTSVPL